MEGMPRVVEKSSCSPKDHQGNPEHQHSIEPKLIGERNERSPSHQSNRPDRIKKGMQITAFNSNILFPPLTSKPDHQDVSCESASRKSDHQKGLDLLRFEKSLESREQEITSCAKEKDPVDQRDLRSCCAAPPKWIPHCQKYQSLRAQIHAYMPKIGNNSPAPGQNASYHI